MANIQTPCGQKMTMTEYVRHIPRCVKCAMVYQARRR